MGREKLSPQRALYEAEKEGEPQTGFYSNRNGTNADMKGVVENGTKDV